MVSAAARTPLSLWSACPEPSTCYPRSRDATATEAAPTPAATSETPPDHMRPARSAERGRHGRRTAALSPPPARELGSSSREQRPRGLHSWPAPPTNQRAARGSPGRWPLTPTTHGGENEPVFCGGCRRLCSRSGAGWGWQGGGRGGPGAPSLIGMTHARGRGQGVAGRGALPARAAGTWACPVWPPPRASGSSPTSWTAAPELGPDSEKQAGLGHSQVESGPHKQESRGSLS